MTLPLYLLAIGFFVTGGEAGLALGVAYLAMAVTIDRDTLRT